MTGDERRWWRCAAEGGKEERLTSVRRTARFLTSCGPRPQDQADRSIMDSTQFGRRRVTARSEERT